MQVIQLHHPYEPNQIPNEEVVMVLGFFDGVHKGHQKVIETGKKALIFYILSNLLQRLLN